ncbi:hypothetical protein AA12717_2234 [Gluconacetobacter sacchari DSM 12717]|uniref:Uncharacterized protein n=2 Tax=Gluconacetobacter sacchari TaxID=92759 RepID=A0A7W4IFA9_9PROT|nr:hypothetical protein [Gluconacetobacter sacchari]MBB2161823.1 hypothetical protein [Gluconacetobacter sacchari]GBQ26013.1 hypothetical protein AA12717_2234 [Gluconacetobacter sacchari DSM 12717]
MSERDDGERDLLRQAIAAARADKRPAVPQAEARRILEADLARVRERIAAVETEARRVRHAG